MSTAPRRLLLRGLMALVGLAALAFYGLVAYAGVRLLSFLWSVRPDPATTVLAIVLATLLGAVLSHWVGTNRLLRRLDAVEVPRERAPALHRRLDALCAEMDVRRPRLFLATFPAPNAISLGGARRGAIVFDRRLLELLGPDEVDALLAHELAHLESNDAFVQTLVYSAGRTVTWLVLLALSPLLLLATGGARAVAWLRGRPGAWPRTAFGRVRIHIERGVLLVLSLLSLAVLAYSRHREYAADERAATVTGDPLAMARALRRIEQAARPSRGLLSLLYVQTEERSDEGLRELLSTHPPTDERIDRLLEQGQGTAELRRESG